MVDKITSIIDRHEFDPPGTPRPDLIADIERLLEMVRSGRVDGIAYAIVFNDDATDWTVGGRITRSMIGALECAKFDLVKGDVQGA